MLEWKVQRLVLVRENSNQSKLNVWTRMVEKRMQSIPRRADKILKSQPTSRIASAFWNDANIMMILLKVFIAKCRDNVHQVKRLVRVQDAQNRKRMEKWEFFLPQKKLIFKLQNIVFVQLLDFGSLFAIIGCNMISRI